MHEDAHLEAQYEDRFTADSDYDEYSYYDRDGEDKIDTDPCTCCKPPRAAIFDHSCSEWVHVDYGTEASMFHIHVETASRDCDGPMEHYTTYQITSLRWTEDELGFKTPSTPDADDLWVKLAAIEAPLHTACEVKVSFLDGESGLKRLTWHHRTEEGYSGGEMRGCTDPSCAYDKSSQRDHFAEAMGY